MLGPRPPRPRRSARTRRLRPRTRRSRGGRNDLLDECFELGLNVRNRRHLRLARSRSLKRLARGDQTFLLFFPTRARMMRPLARFGGVTIPGEHRSEDAKFEIAPLRTL